MAGLHRVKDLGLGMVGDGYYFTAPNNTPTFFVKQLFPHLVGSL